MRIASLAQTAFPAGMAYQPAARQSIPTRRFVADITTIRSAESLSVNPASPLMDENISAQRLRWINRSIYPRLKTKRPRDCFRLALENGLNTKEYHALEMKAVRGLAAQRLGRGEPCDTLSRIYGGIGGLHFEAREALEMIAVDGPAALHIRQGRSVSRVCRKWGIITKAARERLQHLARARQAEDPRTLSEPLRQQRAAASGGWPVVIRTTVGGMTAPGYLRRSTSKQ